MNKIVLAYNFNPERLQQLRQVCMILKVNCKAVLQEQLDDAVGFLAGIKECPQTAVNPPENQEEKLAETLEEAILDRTLWVRLYESAIGAHIMSYAYAGKYKVYYWRNGECCEVDYVLEKNGKLIAIEVKSNSDQWNRGLSEFNGMFKPYLSLVVGEGGMKAEDFLSINPVDLFK